ncbi:MAG: carbohydrate ABC transporter permease [Lachnospiraceae bacterium]|nr:carbohydrate ABC transporter permease [Lachnospiraceae bacterium]
MKKVRKRMVSALLTLLTVILVIIAIFPLYWLISTSMKSKMDAFAIPFKWIFTPSFNNYQELLGSREFIKCYINSLIVATGTTAVSLVFGLTAGYALSRSRGKLGAAMGTGIILARMVPPMSLIIPFFVVFSQFGLTDNHITLILMYLTTVLPFVTWLMMGFFQGVPVELEEAAYIDGCSRIQAFLRVCIPVVRPGVVTSAMFAFMMSWNEYFYAVIMTANKTKTLTIFIQSFVNSSGTNWGLLCAASVLVIIPILAFTIFAQKSFVRGLMGGAVKG